MTSPSPRNLRTTASNTLRRIRCCKTWSFVAAWALGAGGLLGALPAAADDSPLERLQQRSGDARWEEIRSRANAGAPMPAALSPRAPGGGLAGSIAAPAPSADAAPAAPEQESAPPIPDDETDFEAVPGAPFGIERHELSTAPFPERRFPGERRALPPARATFVQADAPDAPLPDDDLTPQSPLRTQPIPLRPITQIQPFFDYSPTGDDPCEHLCPAPEGLCPDDPNRLCPQPYDMPMSASAERYFPHLEFYWAASDLFHNPLYFENPALERYGHVHVNDCVEPAYSMARFGAQLVGLPYQMALDHACRRQYALGWYRPGDFAPKLIYQPPLNARAAGTAAAAYTGIFLLVP